LIKVILADDERLICDAVAMLLNLERDISVAGVASNGIEAVVLAGKMKPDVAVIDLQMSDLDGIEVARRLSALPKPVPSLIITSHALPGILRAALLAGVRGFIPKDTPGEKLAEAVRQVASGARYIDPALAAEAMALGDSPLTPRETEILRMVIGGATVEKVAAMAGISTSTVQNHISAACAKLGAENRHEAAHLAQSRGWL